MFKSPGVKKIETYFLEYQLVLAVDVTMQGPIILFRTGHTSVHIIDHDLLISC